MGSAGCATCPSPIWLFFWGGGGRARPLVPRARGTLEERRSSSGGALGIRCRPGSSGSCARRVLHGILGAISAGLLVLIFLTALIGEPSSAQNLSPTFIYVIFWLGLVPLQVRVRERLARPEPVARACERRRVDLAEARAGMEAAARVSRAARCSGRRRSSSCASRHSSSATPSRPARGRWRSRSRSTATRCGSAWPPTGGASGTRAGTASPSTSACSHGSRHSGSTRAGSCGGCRSPVSRAARRRRACWHSSP